MTPTHTGFGYDKKDDMVQVSELNRFVSLDGVPWHDSEGKDRIKAGSALECWIDLRKKDSKKLERFVIKEIPRVRHAMALKMSDHVYQPYPQQIDYKKSPIIINNACSSWHELAARFTYAGARAYIGSLFPITNFEATDFSISLFRSYLGKPLASAIWEVQQKLYGDAIRHPYIMVGPHFVKLQISNINVPGYIANYLEELLQHRKKQSEHHPDDEVRRNAKKFAEFIEDELIKHKKRWDRFL
jgi:hypothetical protein